MLFLEACDTLCCSCSIPKNLYFKRRDAGKSKDDLTSAAKFKDEYGHALHPKRTG